MASIVNKRSVTKQKIVKNIAQLASLTNRYLRQTAALVDENFHLIKVLTAIESGEEESGMKRGRSASFGSRVFEVRW